MEKPECTLMFSARWRWPRCWISTAVNLEPLDGTQAGIVRFWADADTQHAKCEYPLAEPWDGPLSDRVQEMVNRHSASLTSLGHTIGVLLGAQNSGADMYYQYGERGKWYPLTIDLRPTLWDWSGPVGVEGPPSDLASLLASSLAVQHGDALQMLSVAAGIGNPVARYLCTWQALVLHLGSDSPKEVDRVLSEQLGVPLDCEGHHGSESKFAQFRNWLSHPEDRSTRSYADLDTRARGISDEFARAVLRLILAGGAAPPVPAWTMWG